MSEVFYRNNLLVWNERRGKTQDEKLNKTKCFKDVKKYSFQYRTIDTRNVMERVRVRAESVHSIPHVTNS